MKILSEQELASLLNISKWTVRKWRLNGGLPHVQVGRRIFYTVEAVEGWIRKAEMMCGGIVQTQEQFVPVM